MADVIKRRINYLWGKLKFCIIHECNLLIWATRRADKAYLTCTSDPCYHFSLESRFHNNFLLRVSFSRKTDDACHVSALDPCSFIMLLLTYHLGYFMFLLCACSLYGLYSLITLFLDVGSLDCSFNSRRINETPIFQILFSFQRMNCLQNNFKICVGVGGVDG